MAKIFLAFQGSGKTFFCQNQTNVKAVDHDFKQYDHKKADWLDDYVQDLKNLDLDPSIDMIFCNISKDLMAKLCKDNVPFKVITPLWVQAKDQTWQRTKEITFGRLVLRQQQTPRNVGWIEKLKAHFDEWTSYEFFDEFIAGDLNNIIELTPNKSTVTEVLA